MSEINPTFEQSMHELENIVGQLEDGKLDLDKTLTLFERGVSLTKQCQQTLDQAKLQVNEIMDQNGDIVEAPFDHPEDDHA